ncbi:N-formylglutamate amidohydrolase [Tsuneonella sp. HG222]
MRDQAFRTLGTPRQGGIVAICDHASNFVPEDIVLGVSPERMTQHIAWDIGTAGICELLARDLGIAAHLATFSRLVIDANREEDSPGLVPETSDGVAIPGNVGADVEARLARFYRPYHAALADWLDEVDPRLVLSIHSFTPSLESAPAERPWEIALLYNEDDRAARHGLRLLREQGFATGENEPYSGKGLNQTMNRHAEARGRPYLGFEIRQDLIGTGAGQARFAAVVADVAGRVALALEAG